MTAAARGLCERAVTRRRLIRGHCKEIGSRWRALPAGKIAGIVLAVLRCGQRPGDLAGGNGIHRTTVTRWVREVVGLLAARAPHLDRDLKEIARKGGGVVLLDGSLIRTRRRTGTAKRKNYSGKHKHHGLLVIALTDDKSRLLWASAARPGRTSEITACRHDKLTHKLREAGLGAIADLGFLGLDTSGPDADPAVITGCKAARNRPPTRAQKLSNKALAAVRAPVEHGFAHLKNWRVLDKVRTDPKWATALVRALLVLTNREVSR
ncbi:transposase family protein [Streptomyces sp. NPDC057020]|uniref:transposase family protein n=1 Tax=unclassified Streptomyces TaxID=2593676 RepID=UPI0036269F11